MSFEHDRRVQIYPCYINSKRTVAGGRKIAKAKACEDPTPLEIVDCCNRGLKMHAELEPGKGHPRDFMFRGRARVSLRREDGSLANPDIPTRRVLFEKVAELVPRHPGRAKKPAVPASVKQASGAGAGSSGAPNAGKQSGKGGKKKRK